MNFGKLTAVVLLVLAMGNATGQQITSDSDGSDNSKAIVNTALIELKAGLYTSMAAKSLARLGDEAASAAIRTCSLKDMTAKPTLTAIAQMISESFSGPGIIQKESNKTPKMSILLLVYLRSKATTPEEIKAIIDADEIVNRQLKSQAAN